MAVRRIQTRMRRGQSRRVWRGPLLALTLACFAGLAFAAERLASPDWPTATRLSAGTAPTTAALKPSASRTSEPLAQQLLDPGHLPEPMELASAAAPMPAKGESSGEPSNHSGPSAPRATGSKPMSPNRNATTSTANAHSDLVRRPEALTKLSNSQRPASWSQVAEAMSRGDHHKAQQALTSMAKNRDADTRNKALLGLVQLAAGRGDCQETARVTRLLEQHRAASTTLERARQLNTRCRSR